MKVTAFSNVELAENVVLPVKVELLKLPLAEAGAKDKLPLTVPVPFLTFVTNDGLVIVKLGYHIKF